jgi:Ca-activated chloride channel family protein
VEPDSVRAEEWINSFNYNYTLPTRNDEFAIYTDVYRHPLDSRKHMARVSFQAPDLRDDSRLLNVTLVLDASGSMGDGNRIAIARAAADAIRESLRDQDRIAVVQFTDTVIDRLTVEHTRPDGRDVRRSIDRLQPNSATNVQAGLDLGVELADEARRRRPEAYNYVILMSDGVANVDATNPFAILESAGDHRRLNPIRLVTIGVGIANYNDYLLEQLAQHGNGWYRYLDDVLQAQQTFSRENWLNLAKPFADQTRAQVTWNPEFVRSWRIVGYENRVTPDEFFTQDRKEFAEIPSGAATTVFYELELGNEMYTRSASTARLGDIELRWVEPDTGGSRQQYASLSGHWRQDFDAVVDPYLKLGSIVGLAADRYSALPSPGHGDYGSLNWELSELDRKLWSLKGDLGQLTAFNDFGYLLDHMTRYIPPEPPRPADSGYSP